MSGTILLQAFLVFDVFIAGILATVALHHFRAHVETKRVAKARPAQMQNGHLPPAVREHLLEQAETNFERVLDRSAQELQHDLAATAVKLNGLVEKLGSQVISSELERYRTQLAELTKKAEEDIAAATAGIEQHQIDLKTKMAEEVAAEKQKLVEQIDDKLADAVASFLTETLSHNVDLGAQSAYLTDLLNEHKADFKREVSDEV